MASNDQPTTSERRNTPLTDERDPPKVGIFHAKIIDDGKRAVPALFTAIEVLTWQLVTRGILPAEPLADELMRHTRFHSGGEQCLQLLARVTRAAGYPPLVSTRPEVPKWDQRSKHHG